MSPSNTQQPSNDIDPDLLCPSYQSHSYSASVSPRSPHPASDSDRNELSPQGFYAFIMDRLIGSGPDVENVRLVDEWVRQEHQRRAQLQDGPNSPARGHDGDERSDAESEREVAARRLEKIRGLHSEGKSVPVQLHHSTRHFSNRYATVHPSSDVSNVNHSQHSLNHSRRRTHSRRRSHSRSRPHSHSRPHSFRPQFAQFREQRRSVLRLTHDSVGSSTESMGTNSFHSFNPAFSQDQETYAENVRAAVDYIRELVLPFNDAWRRRNAMDDAGFVESQTRSLLDAGGAQLDPISDSSPDTEPDEEHACQNVLESTVLPCNFTRSWKDIDFDDPRAIVCITCDEPLIDQPLFIRGCGHLYCKKCTDGETPCPVKHCGKNSRTFRQIFLV